jgi:hypothetical protein
MSKRLTPVKAIRAFCVECTCGDTEWIRECPSTDCSLFPYRMGKNPNISTETKAKLREIALQQERSVQKNARKSIAA